MLRLTQLNSEPPACRRCTAACESCEGALEPSIGNGMGPPPCRPDEAREAAAEPPFREEVCEPAMEPPRREVYEPAMEGLCWEVCEPATDPSFQEVCEPAPEPPCREEARESATDPP